MTGSPVRFRSYAWVAVLVALVGLSAAGSHVRTVHHDYSVWAWTPGRATPRMPFAGRLYVRGTVVNSLPPDLIRRGHSPAGGQIFGPPAAAGHTATALWVRYPDGTIWTYGLSGGP